MAKTIKWVKCIDCGEIIPMVAGAPFIGAVETAEGWVCKVCDDFNHGWPS